VLRTGVTLATDCSSSRWSDAMVAAVLTAIVVTVPASAAGTDMALPGVTCTAAFTGRSILP
jgi:hypothetical protein